MKLKYLKKFFKIWFPPLIIAVIIFILSSSPATDSDRQSGFIVNIITSISPSLKNADFLVTIVRKSAHFLEYTTLGFLTARGFNLSKKSLWWAIPTCALYAMTDEFHQTFVSGRSGELRDTLIDTLGATTGILLYYLTARARKQKK